MVIKNDNRGSTVEVSERYLETYELGDLPRAWSWDSKYPGFGVQHGKLRTSFLVQRRVDGKQVRTTLGHWASQRERAANPAVRAVTITVAMARELATKSIADMNDGIDPHAAKRPGAGGPTLRDGLDQHVRNMRKKNRAERSIETMGNEVLRLLPDYVDKPIAELTTEVLNVLHDKLSDKSKKSLANRLVAHVSAIWNSLDAAHALPGKNPARARAVIRNAYEPSRKRIDSEELKGWYEKVQTITPVRRDLQLFCLFTGMRSDAARHVRWEHVDFKNAMLLVPKPKGGEKREFVLPLPKIVVAALQKRLIENAKQFDTYGGDSGWVFPSLTRAAPYEVQPIAEAKEYRQKGRGGPKVKYLPGLHDLRRTYLSVAAEVGISDLDRHVLANHAFGRQSVNASYIKQSIAHLAECQAKIERALCEHIGIKSGVPRTSKR